MSRSPASRFKDLEALAVKAQWRALLSDAARDGTGVKLRLRGLLVQAIESELLPAGSRLPSSRILATALGMARTTLVAVQQDLMLEGYLTARDRSGTFVAEADARPSSDRSSRARTGRDWAERFAICVDTITNPCKPRDWRSYRYPFLFGELDPELFPLADWREAVRVSNSALAVQSWSADMFDEDDPSLVEQIRLQVLPRRGIWAKPDEIMITLGSQQALYLLLRLFAGPETAVGVENPGYPDLRRMAGLHTGLVRDLSVDAEGAVPDRVMASCSLVLLTPGHQSPTTVAMTEARRREILRLARSRDIIVVEDDYDADLFCEGDPNPTLRASDENREVIYVGSFSKILSPGLRLGFVLAPPQVIEAMRALRRLVMRHPPANNQRALATFIALGLYRGHLRRLGTVLAERAKLVDAALPRVLAGCTWQRAAGASSVWVTGPDNLDAVDLAAAARKDGVLFEPGGAFFGEPERGRHSFRLGFSSLPTSRIEQGLERLGRAMAQLNSGASGAARTTRVSGRAISADVDVF